MASQIAYYWTDLAGVVINDMPPGEYSVTAVHAGQKTPGDYELRTRRVPDDHAATVATAGRAGPGYRAFGSAIEGDTGDWFRMELDEGFLGGAMSDIQIIADKADGSSINYAVSLYDSGGGLIELKSDNANVIPDITPGTYFGHVVRVPVMGRGEGDYEFHAEAVRDAPGVDDSRSDALTYTAAGIEGSLIAGEVWDYYRYDLAAGTYFMGIHGNKTPGYGLSSPSMYLLDANGRNVASTWPNQALEKLETVVLPQGGTYYLRVFAPFDRKGSYRTFLSTDMNGDSLDHER